MPERFTTMRRIPTRYAKAWLTSPFKPQAHVMAVVKVVKCPQLYSAGIHYLSDDVQEPSCVYFMIMLQTGNHLVHSPGILRRRFITRNSKDYWCVTPMAYKDMRSITPKVPLTVNGESYALSEDSGNLLLKEVKEMQKAISEYTDKVE